jgi:hypothetical protein
MVNLYIASGNSSIAFGEVFALCRKSGEFSLADDNATGGHETVREE